MRAATRERDNNFFEQETDNMIIIHRTYDLNKLYESFTVGHIIFWCTINAPMYWLVSICRESSN